MDTFVAALQNVRLPLPFYIANLVGRHPDVETKLPGNTPALGEVEDKLLPQVRAGGGGV